MFLSKQKIEAKVASQTMEACEQIISEMGAELHDDLIQKLSVLRLHMDKIERSSYDPAETRTIINRMQSEFDNITDTVRRISRRLMPVKMEGDSFTTMVESLCNNMNTPGSLRIHFNHEGEIKRLATQTEAYLLRMIQELIHNALRHSSAWHVWIDLMWQKDSLLIKVEDDGSGFSKISEFVSRLRKKHNTLRMRAQVIGATIQYKQGAKGLQAVIQLPLNL